MSKAQITKEHEPRVAAQQWASLFCCYSWEDRPFVEELRDRLGRSGVRLRGDWEFVDGQNFQAQGDRLTLECEFFMVVMTPTCISSAQCGRELAFALRLGKRIFPVLRADCSDAELAQLPEAVRVIDFTHLRPQDDQETGTSNLLNALRTDLQLALIHRRLSVRTDDWTAGVGGFASREELRIFNAFKNDTASRPNVLPQPSAAQLEFLDASEQFQRVRTRKLRTLGGSITLTIAGLLAVGGVLWFRNRQGDTVRAISDAKGYVEYTKNAVRLYLDSGGNPEKALALMSRLPNVTELDLADTLVSDRMLQSLKHVEGVTRLMLYNTSITDDGLQNIGAFKNLKYLDLHDTKVTDKGLQHLASLAGLDELNVSTTGVTFDSPVQLPKALRVLKAAYNDIDDDGLENLVAAQAVQYLDLGDTSITDEGLSHLARMRTLKELDVASNEVTSEGLMRLAGLANTLETLDLEDTRIDDEGLQHLQPLKLLKRLSLLFDHVGDHGIRYLAPLPSLRTLTLDSTNVTGSGFESFSPDAPLEDISAKESKFNDEGLRTLSKLRHLKAIGVPGTKITDEGLQALQGLKLQELYIGGNKISDRGIAYVAGMTSLRKFWLLGNTVTDKSIPVFEGLTNLQELQFGYTQVSNKGIEELKKRLPKADIGKGPQ